MNLNNHLIYLFTCNLLCPYIFSASVKYNERSTEKIELKEVTHQTKGCRLRKLLIFRYWTVDSIQRKLNLENDFRKFLGDLFEAAWNKRKICQ